MEEYINEQLNRNFASKRINWEQCKYGLWKENTRWIPVEESLPEERTRVLVKLHTGYVHVGQLRNGVFESVETAKVFMYVLSWRLIEFE